MASEACRQTVCGVASLDRLGGKPPSRLAGSLANGSRRRSKQKLYHILNTHTVTALALILSSMSGRKGVERWGHLQRKNHVRASLHVECGRLGKLAVISNTLVEGCIEITSCHDL